MKKVYILEHIVKEMVENELSEESFLLGIYSTMKNAEEAILYYKEQSGFKDYPDGFKIIEFIIDEHHYKDGFELPENITSIKGYMDDSENEERKNEYSIFLLQHYFEYDDENDNNCEETRKLGVYSTWEKGIEAKKHYKSMNGFKDLPDDCFYLEGCRIDVNSNWIDGFIEVEESTNDQK